MSNKRILIDSSGYDNLTNGKEYNVIQMFNKYKYVTIYRLIDDNGNEEYALSNRFE